VGAVSVVVELTEAETSESRSLSANRAQAIEAQHLRPSSPSSLRRLTRHHNSLKSHRQEDIPKTEALKRLLL
jgi:hypothetical protein